MTTEQAEQDIDPIYTLPEEIQKENARLKKVFGDKKPSPEQVMGIITGSVMPLLAQIAHTTRTHDEALEHVLDQIDGGESTQFTIEDAKLFDLVITYAREMSKASLESPGIDPNSEAHKKLTEIFAASDLCLKKIESSTLTADPEEDDEEDDDGDEGAN